MKTSPTPRAARSFAAVPFVITGAILLALSTIYGGSRTRISASPNAPEPSQFSGTYDPHIFPCATPKHHFDVTSGKTRIVVQTSAVVPTNDITVTLLFGPDVAPIPLQTEDTGTSSEALVYAPAAGVPAGRYHVQICQTPIRTACRKWRPSITMGFSLSMIRRYRLSAVAAAHRHLSDRSHKLLKIRVQRLASRISPRPAF